MKAKVVIKTKNDFLKWIEKVNIFSNSLLSPEEALLEFNGLNSGNRKKIQKSFKKYDSIRKKNISATDGEYAYILSVLIDCHIIATEYNIDPLTALMCVKPICKIDERIIIKEG